MHYTIYDTDEIDQVASCLWRADARHDLLAIGRGEELRRNRQRHGACDAARADGAVRPFAPRVRVGRLQSINDLHHFRLDSKARRLIRVVLAGCRGLHGAAF